MRAVTKWEIAMLTNFVTAFRSMLVCDAGLTSTEYSTMGGSMAGGISDAGSSLVEASGSAIDAVGAAVTAVTG